MENKNLYWFRWKESKAVTLINLFVIVSIFQLLAILVFFSFSFSPDRAVVHAVLGMALGLYILWIIVFGWITLTFQDGIRRFVDKITIQWQIKFVLFCILLAMLEEVVTTGMTNLAPIFGAQVGQAYITASANYWDVILGHSVIAFVPMFIAWAVLLSYYDFTPSQMFLIFGLTGTIGESFFGGFQNMFQIGMWLFVYGLMIYLPAYCLPHREKAKPPRWYHVILAIFLPFIFAIIFIPIVTPIVYHFRPSAATSFPPFASGQ